MRLRKDEYVTQSGPGQRVVHERRNEFGFPCSGRALKQTDWPMLPKVLECLVLVRIQPVRLNVVVSYLRAEGIRRQLSGRIEVPNQIRNLRLTLEYTRNGSRSTLETDKILRHFKDGTLVQSSGSSDIPDDNRGPARPLRIEISELIAVPLDSD